MHVPFLPQIPSFSGSELGGGAGQRTESPGRPGRRLGTVSSVASSKISSGTAGARAGGGSVNSVLSVGGAVVWSRATA